MIIDVYTLFYWIFIFVNTNLSVQLKYIVFNTYSLLQLILLLLFFVIKLAFILVDFIVILIIFGYGILWKYIW
jgi:hypothetical protein